LFEIFPLVPKGGLVKIKSKCPENEHQKNRRTEFKIVKN
jgi:hypothetical protein